MSTQFHKSLERPRVASTCRAALTSLLVLALSGLLTSRTVTAQLAWTNIQTSVTRGQVDLWTSTSSGCTCPYDVLDHTCACCVLNGCHCGQSSPQRCGQCGLEQHCDNMCNITISSREILSRSGQTFGEIKSPSTLSGPAFCWYRLKPEQNQRVEIQIYRIKRLGRLNTDTKRCVGGFLQLAPDSRNFSHDASEVMICGANERYSPPIVLFGPEGAGSNSVLLFRVDETTSQSQFLAHYSFTDVDKEDTGLQIKGGIKVMPSKDNDNSVCDWRFEERHCQTEASKTGCQLATPGYPGVYPPHRRCRYLIEATSKGTQIRLTFKNINLPQEDCETHRVTVYNGPTSASPILKSFCGLVQKQKITGDSDQVLVEFSSGHVLSPFSFNGFIAKIEFIARENNNNNNNNRAISGQSASSSSGTSNRHQPPKSRPTEAAPVDNGDEDGEDEEEANEEADDDEAGGEDYDDEQRHQQQQQREESNRKQSKSRKSKTNIGGSVTTGSDKCQLEISASESRSGTIRSIDLNLVQKKCSILFKGNPGDVVLVKLDTYKLRGKTCDASITLSVKRRNGRESSDVFERVCSPATRRRTDHNGKFVAHPPILINSSFVSLDFLANRIKYDRFVAVYQFHHVLSDGLHVPNTTCDTLYPGRTGSSKGQVESPDAEKSDLFKNWQGPLKCTKSLVPTDSQSLTLKITSSSHGSPAAEDRCETFCDEHGCRCLLDSNVDLETLDYLMVTPLSGEGRVACFCGEFSHMLPINVISSSGLALIYNSAEFRTGSMAFTYTAAYNFQNEEICGPRRVSSPLGSLESPLAISPAQSYHPSSTYFHQQCQWFFDPPPSRQLILKISTVQKMDCLTWNATIAIWNTSVPDQIGTVIDRFCPEISAKEYILNTTERKIVISLHSLAPGPIHFRISWETRGLLASTDLASNVDTKEVIDGGGGGFFGGISTGSRSIFTSEMVLISCTISIVCVVVTNLGLTRFTT